MEATLHDSQSIYKLLRGSSGIKWVNISIVEAWDGLTGCTKLLLDVVDGRGNQKHELIKLGLGITHRELVPLTHAGRWGLFMSRKFNDLNRRPWLATTLPFPAFGGDPFADDVLVQDVQNFAGFAICIGRHYHFVNTNVRYC